MFILGVSHAENHGRRLPPDRVTCQANSDLQERPKPVFQRPGPDRRAAVEDRRSLAERFAEGLVIGVPPEVANGGGLPYAELDVDAFVQAELGVGPAQPGFLDTAPRALASAVAEHVIVDPDHASLDFP